MSTAAAHSAGSPASSFPEAQHAAQPRQALISVEEDTDGLVDVPLVPQGSQDSSYGSAHAVLAKENAGLKARLQVVEEAAADALGELQDLKDELQAHKEARQAAEQQVGPGKALGR